MNPLSTQCVRRAARAYAEAYMAGTAIIQSYALVSDGIGGGTATYTNAGTVRCTVGPAPYRWFPNEGVHQDLLQDVPYWLVLVPYSATVTPTSRIVVGTVTYEVMETNSDTTDRIYTSCKCAVIS